MRKKIFRNWGLKLGSLVLAFVLWLLVVQIDDPKETRVFYGIPVIMTNTELLDQQDKVYQVLDNTDTIRVSIRAPRSVFSDLRASDIVAEADMSKLTEINTIAISFRVLNNDVDTITGSPDVLRLNVENRVSKWVTVRYVTTGEVAEGYMVVSAAPNQTRIEVTGPESDIEQVSYASVVLDVSGAMTDVSANVECSLYGKDDNLLDLPSVTKNVDYVLMTAQILATKTVPIDLRLSGAPADGFLATGEVACEPSDVLLAGTPEALAEVSAIAIPEEELNISGSAGNFTKEINIGKYLPENTRLADRSFSGNVNVTVYIEPEMARTLTVNTQNITIANLPEGLKIEPEDDPQGPIELRVSGLEETVSLLQANTLTGVADIRAWMANEGLEELAPGTYFIPIAFQLPEGVVVENRATLRVAIIRSEDS